MLLGSDGGELYNMYQVLFDESGKPNCAMVDGSSSSHHVRRRNEFGEAVRTVGYEPAGYGHTDQEHAVIPTIGRLSRALFNKHEVGEHARWRLLPYLRNETASAAETGQAYSHIGF